MSLTMTKQQRARRVFLVLALVGVAVTIVGVVVLALVGGWAATAIGTPRSATPGGFIAAYLVLCGPTLVFVGLVGAAFSRWIR